jgi:hypothetical protein
MIFHIHLENQLLITILKTLFLKNIINKSKYIWTIMKIRNKGFNVIMEIDMAIRNNFRVFKTKI